MMGMRSQARHRWIPLFALSVLTGCAGLLHGGRGGSARGPLPTGKALSALTRAECRQLLTARGVAFEDVPWSAARGIEIPIRLGGELNGLNWRAPSEPQSASFLDCRLAVSLLRWTERLRAGGVSELVALSLYRPYARVQRLGTSSGHAHGLAIDVGRLVLRGGEVLDVEKTWTDKRRGVPPCPSRDGEAAGQRQLRSLICAAVDEHLFQVVLTPHADADHHNHVHLEVRPDLTTPCIR